MYHVGRILKIFKASDAESRSADNSVQAHLEMWDENEIIVLVHPSLVHELKEKDLVLVRYTQPEPVVVRIFKPKEGKEAWDRMVEYSDRKKKASAQSIAYRDNPVGRMIG